jgi:tetratricopeptide (TPR) repeat protein
LLSREIQSRRALPRRRDACLLIAIGVCLSANLGCQSLHPFAQKTHEKIVSARQWASGGIEAFQCGKLDQAKGHFSRAAEQNPNDDSVRANLARTLHRTGETQQAIAEMQQAVNLSNRDPRMLVELGEMYLEAGQWIPARRQVELALQANPRSAAAWVLSGKTAKAKGDYSQALADFQRGLGFDSEMSEVHMQIIDTYQKMGQPFRALSTAEQFLSQHPADDQPEPAVIAKSVALIELDQLTPAIEILQTASQKDKASGEVFVRLSQAQLLAGQVSQARLTLNRGKQAFPDVAAFDQLIGQLTNVEQRVASVENLRAR